MGRLPPQEGKQNVLLRQAREEHNLSQSQVAQQVGVDERTYRRWENEGSLPQPYAQRKLLRLFGKTTPEELGFAERTRRTLSPSQQKDQAGPQESARESIALVQAPLDREERSGIELQHRARFLQRLQKTYIEVQDASLQDMAPLTLKMHEDSSLVHMQRRAPWRTEYSNRPLAEGTSILDAFDQAGQSLLILGAPGSGKTTILYELALALVERARQDATQSLPVVLSLSSWTGTSQSLTGWLAEEIEVHYLLPRSLATQWLQANHILLLLDGLDELAPSARTACINKLNAYHARQGVPLVVCSRQQEYWNQTGRLALQNAILLQPLSRQQVASYLEQAGPSLTSVREVVSRNRVLFDLLTTPLFLNIVILAFRDRSITDIPQLGTPEEQQRAIFESYVRRMLEQKEGKLSYSSQRIVHWLSWLAWQLQQRYQSEFYLERLQLDWLPPSRWYPFFLCVSIGVLYGLLLGLCAGLWNGINPSTASINISVVLGSFLLFGLIIGCLYIGLNTLAFQCFSIPRALSPPRVRDGERRTTFSLLAHVRTSRFAFGSLLGLAYGLWVFTHDLLGTLVLPVALISAFIWTPLAMMMAIIVGPFDPKIDPIEMITWSWANTGKRIGLALLVCIVSGLLDGLLLIVFLPFSPSQQITESSVVTLTSFFGITLFASLNMLIGSGISYTSIEKQQRIAPNEGIKRAWRQSLQFGLLGGGIFGLAAALLLEGTKLLLFHKPAALLGEVRTGLVFALLAAVALWSYNGGLTWYKHTVLRFFLWRRGAISWHYERMLDEAAQHILLYKVGGGYRFVHDLFRDYLASRNDPEV